MKNLKFSLKAICLTSSAFILLNCNGGENNQASSANGNQAIKVTKSAKTKAYDDLKAKFPVVSLVNEHIGKYATPANLDIAYSPSQDAFIDVGENGNIHLMMPGNDYWDTKNLDDNIRNYHVAINSFNGTAVIIGQDLSLYPNGLYSQPVVVSSFNNEDSGVSQGLFQSFVYPMHTMFPLATNYVPVYSLDFLPSVSYFVATGRSSLNDPNLYLSYSYNGVDWQGQVFKVRTGDLQPAEIRGMVQDPEGHAYAVGVAQNGEGVIYNSTFSNLFSSTPTWQLIYHTPNGKITAVANTGVNGGNVMAVGDNGMFYLVLEQGNNILISAQNITGDNTRLNGIATHYVSQSYYPTLVVGDNGEYYTNPGPTFKSTQWKGQTLLNPVNLYKVVFGNVKGVNEFEMVGEDGFENSVPDIQLPNKTIQKK